MLLFILLIIIVLIYLIYPLFFINKINTFGRQITEKKDLKVPKSSDIVVKTSGTSGNVVAIHYTFETFQKTQFIVGKTILQSFILKWFTIHNRRIKIAFLIYTGDTMTHQLAKSLPVLSRLILDIKIISFQDPDVIKKLENYQPDVIMSYPSFLDTILDKVKISPSLVITGSELLSQKTKKRIRNTFLKADIIETYGCTECPFIAVSCNKGNLHLNEDYCSIELVDHNNQILPWKVGVLSHRILLTNYVNTHQPIIRYLLDDSIEILPPCPCGNKKKTIKVHGRADDVFFLYNLSNKLDKILPISLETCIFLELPLISYQIIHARQNFLIINYISDHNITNLIMNKVEEFFINYNIHYQINRVNEIERTKGGKVRQIISLI